MLMNINYPANYAYVGEMAASVMRLDVLDPEWTTQSLFDFEYDKKLAEVDDRILTSTIQNLGFHTFSSILNLSGVYSIFVLILASYVLLFLFWMFHACIESCISGKEIKRYRQEMKTRTTRYYKFACTVKLHYKLKKICDGIMNNLFLTAPILLVYEQVVQFSMLTMLHFLSPDADIEQEYKTKLASEIVAYTCGVSVFILLPMLCVVIVCSSEKRLGNESYQDIFGALFVQLRHSNRWYLAYNIIFLLRRVIIAVVALFMKERPEIQIVLLLS